MDYGLGNLYSVRQACRSVQLSGIVTSDKSAILNADAVILPGVGAFGQAMETLRRLDLVSVLQDIGASSKPLIGICLGLQLFMSESDEFGCHKGLNIVEGVVRRFDNPKENGRILKVPHVGWNRIFPFGIEKKWSISLFDRVSVGTYMYFVHSFTVHPVYDEVKAIRTQYGTVEFCSGIQKQNLWGFQFHPERSGPEGLRIYQNLSNQLYSMKNGKC